MVNIAPSFRKEVCEFKSLSLHMGNERICSYLSDQFSEMRHFETKDNFRVLNPAGNNVIGCMFLVWQYELRWDQVRLYNLLDF